MKKLIVIGILIGVLILALGLAGLVFAQSPTPEPGQDAGFGPGMMGGYGGMMGGRGFAGMMGGRIKGDHGPMHEYMEQAWADALGLTEAELEERLEAGETMWQIAEDLGYSQEELSELMVTARAEALDQAVEDGLLSRAQADWMIEHMEQRQAAGFGHCWGGGRMGGMRGVFGWRWNP